MGRIQEQGTGEPPMVHLRVRVDDDLHRQIEESAKRRGVSTTKEVVDRLEASYAVDELHGHTGPVGPVGDPAEGLLELVSLAAAQAGRGAYYASLGADESFKWTGDAYSYQMAFDAAVRVFEALRPTGEPEGLRQIGTWVADGLLRDVATGEPRTPENFRRVGRIRESLGPALIERLQTALAKGFEPVEIEPREKKP
jgi:hypothetical protein